MDIITNLEPVEFSQVHNISNQPNKALCNTPNSINKFNLII